MSLVDPKIPNQDLLESVVQILDAMAGITPYDCRRGLLSIGVTLEVLSKRVLAYRDLGNNLLVGKVMVYRVLVFEQPIAEFLGGKPHSLGEDIVVEVPTDQCIPVGK